MCVFLRVVHVVKLCFVLVDGRGAYDWARRTGFGCLALGWPGWDHAVVGDTEDTHTDTRHTERK